MVVLFVFTLVYIISIRDRRSVRAAELLLIEQGVDANMRYQTVSRNEDEKEAVIDGEVKQRQQQ